MARLFLQIAFAVIGINFTLLKLGEMLHTDSPRLIAIVACLPAAVVGAASWLMNRSFARAWPVVGCLTLAWLGLLYAGLPNNNRGLVCITYLTLAVPLAALIVEQRCWWSCVRTYVLATAGALAFVIWFEFWIGNRGLGGSLQRLGFLMAEEGGTRTANPNIIGGQLALAAVLALMLHLKNAQWDLQAGRPNRRRSDFSPLWCVFLSIGCLLTASRGAFVAWFGGISLLLFSVRNQTTSKVQEMMVAGAMGVALLWFGAIAAGFQPWQSLQERFESPGEVLTASGRLTIWQDAYSTWRSKPRYMAIGTGIGVAPDRLGQHAHYTLSDGLTLVALDSHNTFVEWGLSLGLVGVMAGLALAASVYRQASRLDRLDGTYNRRAMLLTFALASMTFVTFYKLFFVAAAALLLAAMSEPAQRAVEASGLVVRPSGGDSQHHRNAAA